MAIPFNARPEYKVRTQNAITTLTPNIALYDQEIATGVNGGILIATPTGTPQNGQTLVIRLKDDGTARAITWAVAYRAFGGSALPNTTTAGKNSYFGLIYNATDSKWDVVAVATET
jgi:hypothetical protein